MEENKSNQKGDKPRNGYIPTVADYTKIGTGVGAVAGLVYGLFSIDDGLSFGQKYFGCLGAGTAAGFVTGNVIYGIKKIKDKFSKRNNSGVEDILNE